MRTLTPAATSIAPIQASARISPNSEKISRRCMAMRRAAVGGVRMPSSRASVSSGSKESIYVRLRSNDIRHREADLRGHHHQIHVAPRRMVLGGRELVGIPDDQPDGVGAPDA